MQLGIKRLLLPLCLYLISVSIFSANLCDADQNTKQTITITGTVTDTNGDVLPGVTIVLMPERRVGQMTAKNGKYLFTNLKAGDRLLFSYLGMEPVEIVIKQGKTEYNVKLKDSSHQLDEVMVEAGIIQRNKLGFTGSHSTVTQDELKAMGNINIIQSLKSLDPSFVIADNLMAGSNPNVAANIEIRGQTAISVSTVKEESQSNINMPLIILDGFEASMREFSDLDINRIESVTILKDAGSTAIYGSKGANGVIVVETVKPKRGEVMVRYNSDIQLSFPDLSAYNLMNAAEKLEFELLTGRWGQHVIKQKEYNRRLALVESGVDTYWLSEPVRNAITHNHSLSVSGGETFIYDVGVNYRDNQGVMKESGRETYGGNVKLIYRGPKGLSISNNVVVSGVNASDGAWGKFSDFAMATPYFKKRNDDGSIPKIIDSYDINESRDAPRKKEYAFNPLYNALLNSYQIDREFTFTNNTNIDWYITEKFKINGALSLKKQTQDYQSFQDPRHSQYTYTVYTKKGAYTGKKRNSWSYSANLSTAYSHTLLKHHNLSLIGRVSISEKNHRTEMYQAQGFPEGSKGIPSQAYSYNEGESPFYSDKKRREVTFLSAFNYNYLYRYLFDFNYNIDGSTAFGRNIRFQDFWSVGLGWNLHREAFAKKWKWLSELKVSATIGTNANQNQNLLTDSEYSYYQGSTQFGQGAYLSQYANPDLEWQKTSKKGMLVHAAFWDNRLKLDFSVYNHHSSPLVVTIEQRRSSGVGAYPVNMGYLDTKGYEFGVIFFPVYNRKENILLSLRLMGSHNTSKYGGYGDALNRLNDDYLAKSDSKNLLSILRYEDGRSPYDIWAVRSLGIDPATGREIYLSKEGKKVMHYNYNDRVVVGNTKPDLEGTISLNLIWKKLQVNTTFRYRYGGEMLNKALYNKVENINSSDILNNLDKRALYDRWQKPGDVAAFVAITEVRRGHPLSSRFIQRDNSLGLENAKISWDFSKDNWIKVLYMKDLKIGISINDVFRLSSVQTERGIDYPFARSVIFNLTTRF